MEIHDHDHLTHPLSKGDRLLIEQARRSLDRVRKRLDWLSGSDPVHQ